jgi:hypothetical protein
MWHSCRVLFADFTSSWLPAEYWGWEVFCWAKHVFFKVWSQNTETTELWRTLNFCMRFGVIKAVSINITVFWDVRLCFLIDGDLRNVSAHLPITRRNTTEASTWWNFCIHFVVHLAILQLAQIMQRRPITVAARSEAWNVFARSNAGIVGSNPTQGMDVCV